MKKEIIIKNIESNKDLMRSMGKLSHFNIDDFIWNAERYVKAVKQRRMICVIPHVSNSGMSRVIRFSEMNSNKGQGWVLNFYAFFKALGYKESKSHDGFVISGCGMDMVFHTNYSIIHSLCTLGFISKKECEELAQMTPTVI